MAAAAAAAAADNILRSGEISAMIRQGFLDSPSPTASGASPPSPPAAAASGSHPSPPPPTTTLFDMIAEEERYHQYRQRQGLRHPPLPATGGQRQASRLQERVARILAGEHPGWGVGDVELTVSTRDGFRVSMSVHRGVLAARSRFFAEKLVETREKGAPSYAVEICECDDADDYVEAVALMYCREPCRKLVGETVAKVLGLLKVSAAMLFDAGVSSCLDYLEAVPWTEDEEEKVVSVLSQLRLPNSISKVLARVSVDPADATGSWADDIFLRLLGGILGAKDEKARREMKNLMSGLLCDSGGDDRIDVPEETLYRLCRRCLDNLQACLADAVASSEEGDGRDRGVFSTGEIAREADNVQWLADVLVGRKACGEFVSEWAGRAELARLHARIPCVYRSEMSRITARLCVAVGRGQILAARGAKSAMLRTWLAALYEDFAWMGRRGGRSPDRKLVEEGLGQTILTLPMAEQQSILLDWFDRFLSRGDDCPNIQRAFQVWWRRAFVRQRVEEEDDETSRLQVAACDRTTAPPEEGLPPAACPPAGCSSSSGSSSS